MPLDACIMGPVNGLERNGKDHGHGTLSARSGDRHGGRRAGRQRPASGPGAGALHPQMRQRRARDASRHAPPEGSRRPNPGGDGRASGRAVVSKQPVGLRHGHAQPVAFWRAGAVFDARRGARDPGAGGLAQQRGVCVFGLPDRLAGDGRRCRPVYPRADHQVRDHRDGQDLGQWLPPNHHPVQADHQPGRFARREAAGPGQPTADLAVQGCWAARPPRSISTSSTRPCRRASWTGRKTPCRCWN